MNGRYDRQGNWHTDPAWMQTEDSDDWMQADVEDIDFPERDPEYDAWLDDFDRRASDVYDTANGDIGDDALPPY